MIWAKKIKIKIENHFLQEKLSLEDTNWEIFLFLFFIFEKSSLEDMISTKKKLKIKFNIYYNTINYLYIIKIIIIQFNIKIYYKSNLGLKN